MSRSSSMRRQLAEAPEKTGPALGTTGEPKGPARLQLLAPEDHAGRAARERVRHALALEAAEMADAQAARSTALRRAALAFLLGLGIVASLLVALA